MKNPSPLLKFFRQKFNNARARQELGEWTDSTKESEEKNKVKRIINICSHTFIIITIHVLKEKDRLILYKKRHKVLSPLDINPFYKEDMNYYYYKI